MTSWANRNTSLLKKKEVSLQNYFSPESDDFTTSALSLLYGVVYSQRMAEPFYLYDPKGILQPHIKSNPVVHFLKESPTSGTNLATNPSVMAPILNSMSYPNLKRNILAAYQQSQETSMKIDLFLQNAGLMKQAFDVGIVLDQPSSVGAVITGLKALQKKINKKTFRVFVMTDDMNLLQEFAIKGDPSWTFVSLMRHGSPEDDVYKLYKRFAEIRFLQQTDFLAVRLSSPLGKFLFLTSEKVNTEGQVISLDGSSWKAL